jgi:hypothetical protein
MKKMIFFALVAGWVIVGVLGAGATAAHALSVPLPSTLPLLGLGLAVLFNSRRQGK